MTETKIPELEPPEFRICAVCGTSNEISQLAKSEYHCADCYLQLAYLDIAANGTIRGVFGWVRASGEIIEGR